MSENNIEYLKKSLSDNLKNNILPFWTKYTVDNKYGGYIGHIYNDNTPKYDAGKSIILNTRLLWTFSASTLFLHDNTCFAYADIAYNYLVKNFFDKTYGGVFWELDYTGKPVNKRKQVYAQAFAIYALSEFYKVNKNTEVLNHTIMLFNLIEKYSYDKEEDGYIEAFARDWSAIDDVRLSTKDLNALKTMNTHLHILEAYTNLYRNWKSEQLKSALEKLIRVFLTYFVNEKFHLNLFFSRNWKYIGDIVSYGHDIECSWLLREAAEVIDNTELIEKTKQIAVKMADVTIAEAIDENGGINYELFSNTGKTDYDKHWWVQAEGLVGFINAYQVTGNSDYLNKAMDLWRFIDSKIVNHKFGEWYWKVDKNGNPDTELEKAGFWKCPYHNSRACIEVLSRLL